MARGWESKSVESQQEEAAAKKVVKPQQTPEERARTQQRRTLELSRARLSADLERASVAPHRQMLERAIADLDTQIAGLS